MMRTFFFTIVFLSLQAQAQKIPHFSQGKRFLTVLFEQLCQEKLGWDQLELALSGTEKFPSQLSGFLKEDASTKVQIKYSFSPYGERFYISWTKDGYRLLQSAMHRNPLKCQRFDMSLYNPLAVNTPVLENYNADLNLIESHYKQALVEQPTQNAPAPSPYAFPVGVVDVGIDYNHEKLKPYFARAKNPTQNRPYDFFMAHAQDAMPYDYSLVESSTGKYPMQHGTAVASVMVQGLKNVSLYMAKIDDSSSQESMYSAIQFLLNKGVKIINISSSYVQVGKIESFKIKYLIQSHPEVLFIAAAGNNASSNPVFPAGYNVKNLISVAAVDEKNNLATYSNYGSWVTIAAPGTQLVWDEGNEVSRVSRSGTSFAAPFVANKAISLWQSNPNYTPEGIKNAFCTMGEKSPTLSQAGLACPIILK
jgi:hypothetical protein